MAARISSSTILYKYMSSLVVWTEWKSCSVVGSGQLRTTSSRQWAISSLSDFQPRSQQRRQMARNGSSDWLPKCLDMWNPRPCNDRYPRAAQSNRKDVFHRLWTMSLALAPTGHWLTPELAWWGGWRRCVTYDDQRTCDKRGHEHQSCRPACHGYTCVVHTLCTKTQRDGNRQWGVIEPHSYWQAGNGVQEVTRMSSSNRNCVAWRKYLCRLWSLPYNLSKLST